MNNIFKFLVLKALWVIMLHMLNPTDISRKWMNETKYQLTTILDKMRRENPTLKDWDNTTTKEA